MDRDTGWCKSSYSSGGNDSCVEVRLTASIGVRDSKNPDSGELWVKPAAWATFLAAAPTMRRPDRQR